MIAASYQQVFQLKAGDHLLRYHPIPTPYANLIEVGMALASHCLNPSSDNPTNVNPSTNTAAKASL
jgi:hypothetical protein